MGKFSDWLKTQPEDRFCASSIRTLDNRMCITGFWYDFNGVGWGDLSSNPDNLIGPPGKKILRNHVIIKRASQLGIKQLPPDLVSTYDITFWQVGVEAAKEYAVRALQEQGL